MCVKNILSLKKYSFLKALSDSSVSLTPLSQQIKQNIAFEWIKCIRRLPAIDLFVSPLTAHLDPIPKTQINSFKSISENYNNYYKPWSEGSLHSIGIIEPFVCQRDPKVKTFFNANKNDCLVFALFCQKHESLYWFQKLQGIHSQWFRNLSKSPLKSKFSDEMNEKSQKWSLNYKTEEVVNQLESIECFSGSIAEKKFGITDKNVISCQLDLDNCVIAFLCDAFSTKVQSNGNKTKKMKLHSSLAPFKVGLSFRDNCETNQVLIELARYIIDSLKQFDIPVLPFTPNNPISIESYDELGIPFTVILDKESAEKGAIGLRNRDSDTEESVHISRFQQTVCLYLHLFHPNKLRNKY